MRQRAGRSRATVSVKRSGDAAQVLYELVPGERVRLAQVVGRGFQLENFYGKDLIFIAMGTGVAPLRSALRSALTKVNQFKRLMVPTEAHARRFLLSP
ncbi:MAG: hypothetical protein WKF84_16255 [Pyrinomonadaceae bacterium]